MIFVDSPIRFYTARLLSASPRPDFSGTDPVSDALVSHVNGPARCALHDRDGGRRDRRAAFKLTAALDGAGVTRMAMALPDRGRAGDLLAPVVLRYLTERPADARWLTGEERAWLARDRR